jgi:tRNA G18 (ribose-2'-O)-methylase SpoU
MIDARFTSVSAIDDPRLSDYRDLKEAHLASRAQAFIAESEFVLRVLLTQGRHPVRSLLIAAPRLDKVRDALALCDPAIPIYVGEQALLDQVAGFRVHRGILASGQREAVPEPAALLATLPARATVVALEALTNHDNVGGVFRNAAAFGADAVLFDAATCDPLYRKSIRVSVGASLFVPYARGATSAGCLAALSDAGFVSIALSPSADARDIATLWQQGAPPPRVALWLGTEGAGLSAATLAAADVVARIAMAPGFDSLNVATTSGIALYALRHAGVT